MLLEAWKEFEVFHLCPMPLCHLLPLSRASHVRARLKRVSNLLFRAPIMLPPTQGYRSFRYNFIQSTCKLFHRVRNNGRSTDNVRTDWGVDQSTFRLAGHVDRSQSIVLKMKSVVSIVISM